MSKYSILLIILFSLLIIIFLINYSNEGFSDFTQLATTEPIPTDYYQISQTTNPTKTYKQNITNDDNINELEDDNELGDLKIPSELSIARAMSTKIKVDSDYSNPNDDTSILYKKQKGLNYVPTSDRSIYDSTTTGQSIVSPVGDTDALLGGFCSFNKNDSQKLEQSCNATSLDSCSSTSCCVLLGGEKCVSGNKQGPTFKSNYSEIQLINRDYYYYKGKCYGDCINRNIQTSMPPTTSPTFTTPTTSPIFTTPTTSPIFTTPTTSPTYYTISNSSPTK